MIETTVKHRITNGDNDARRILRNHHADWLRQITANMTKTT